MCSKQKTDDGLASSIHAALDSDPRIASLTPVDNKKAPVISNQTRLDLAGWLSNIAGMDSTFTY